jgi:hypothetical protein
MFELASPLNLATDRFLFRSGGGGNAAAGKAQEYLA